MSGKARRAKRRNPREDRYRSIYDLITSVPAELQEAFLRVIDEVVPVLNRLQVPPDQAIAGGAVMMASLLLCNLDDRDEIEINRRLNVASDALTVAVAIRRLQTGAVGPRPDGSFGIRTDA